MSASSSTRRDFLQMALGAACLSSLSNLGFASSFLADEHTARFRAAKFGMFIHWGPYSLASVEASWPIMVPKAGGSTEPEYRAPPKTVNPAQVDPDAFIDLSRAARQRYMGFNNTHHSGFRMIESSYTD